jgi:DNA-binding transcriptional regulator YiaG
MERIAGDGDPPADAWSSDAIRGLREHLGDTQQTFADRLGTRQQTVSEWERSTSRPRRMARRLLRMVAEESGFYDAPDRSGSP